jgi:hypothetical protein
MRHLLALVPGSSKAWWKRSVLPDLERRGVVVKFGRGWLARPADLEAALSPQRAPGTSVVSPTAP